MKCPIDDSVLQLSERRGIEIDYCPTCRGVWLDRGELDKLLEGDRRREREYDQWRPPEKKKRKSFLGEILEFGD